GPTHSRHGPTHRVESFCAAFSQVPGRNPLTDRLNAGGGVWGRGWARAGLGAGAGAGGCWGWGAGRARAVDQTVRTSPEVGTPVPAVTMSFSAPGTWFTDWPRSWRTPSAMPFMPWMYASPSWPP